MNFEMLYIEPSIKEKQIQKLDMLFKTKDLITKGWCKNAFARDKDNKECKIDDKNACKFCLAGALFFIAHCWDNQYLGRYLANSLLEDLRKQIKMEPINHFNDQQETPEPIISLIDSEIKSLEQILKEDAK